MFSGGDGGGGGCVSERVKERVCARACAHFVLNLAAGELCSFSVHTSCLIIMKV